MTIKTDNKNKFSFAKQTSNESLTVRHERYLNAISSDGVNEVNLNLKKILVSLDKNTHYQLSIVHKYFKKTQNDYVLELIKKDLKKNFPAAWDSLNKEFYNK